MKDKWKYDPATQAFAMDLSGPDRHRNLQRLMNREERLLTLSPHYVSWVTILQFCCVVFLILFYCMTGSPLHGWAWLVPLIFLGCALSSFRDDRKLARRAAQFRESLAPLRDAAVKNAE